MRRFVALCMLLLAANFTAAQRAVGSWQSHLSYHDATKVAVGGSRVYTLANGALYSYDTEDNSVTCYYKSEPLSDTDISLIAYNTNNHTLLIVYSNSNIDMLTDEGKLFNMDELKNKSMALDKTVNSVFFTGNTAYLSTNFGVMVVDMERREVKNSYILNRKVKSCAVLNGRIFAATEDGLLTAQLTENLLDVNNWNIASDKTFSCLSVFKEQLVGCVAHDAIYLINTVDFGCEQLLKGNYSFMNLCSNKLLAGNGDALAIFSDIREFKYLSPYMNMADIACKGNTYWMAQHEKGLTGWRLDSNTNSFVATTESVVPNSPVRNYSYSMSVVDGRLLVAGGGINSDRYLRKGTAMSYEDGTWTNFQDDGIENYRDITSIAQDPRDSRHHLLASAGEGLYDFYDGKFTKLYSTDNSTLESAISGDLHYVRTNGIVYDNMNNLWVVNTGRDVVNNLHVLTASGEWKALNYSELNNKTNLSRAVIDSRGWLWITSSWQLDDGIFCLDTNNTPLEQSDDRHRFISQLTDQNSTLLTHKGIYCVAEDRDGNIWLGTGDGPLRLSSPEDFFEDDFRCERIKVARNNDSSLADYLLANNRINDIVVDAANRKWMATDANGLYLLSADGTETLEHFTTDNSPLPSNSVTALAMDHSKGTLYIGTLNGIVSYQTEATEGETSFRKESVYAYPNPVRPDYGGAVTIAGLMNNSDVKITDAAGGLVYEGTSTGGQMTWNLCNKSGRKVASGIYFVLASDENGASGIVTKIAVIR